MLNIMEKKISFLIHKIKDLNFFKALEDFIYLFKTLFYSLLMIM